MNTMPELTICPDGSSGIEIRAKLKKKHNCVEFTLRDDVPVPVFISPFMQWEPADMMNERLEIANEIVRRANAYEGVVEMLATSQRDIAHRMDELDKQRDEMNRYIEMWRAERTKLGLPSNFSDISFDVVN